MCTRARARVCELRARARVCVCVCVCYLGSEIKSHAIRVLNPYEKKTATIVVSEGSEADLC